MKAYFVMGVFHETESFDMISDIFLNEEEAIRYLNSIDKASNEYKFFDDFQIDSQDISQESMDKLVEKIGIISEGLLFKRYNGKTWEVIRPGSDVGFWHCERTDKLEIPIEFSEELILQCLIEG